MSRGSIAFNACAERLLNAYTESWWDGADALLHAVSRKMNGPVQKVGFRCLPILQTY